MCVYTRQQGERKKNPTVIQSDLKWKQMEYGYTVMCVTSIRQRAKGKINTAPFLTRAVSG